MSKELINGVDFSSGLIAIIRSKTTEEGRNFSPHQVLVLTTSSQCAIPSLERAGWQLGE
jgi:hypothetical protein